MAKFNIEKAQEFNESTVTYQAGSDIPVFKTCFAWAVTNIGDTIAIVNGKRLFPSATPATVIGDSISISAPRGQVYKGRIKLSFLVPLGAAPNVEVTQLFYLDEKESE